MRVFSFIICVILASCTTKVERHDSVKMDLYSLDLGSPELMDDCYYLTVYDGNCFGNSKKNLDLYIISKVRNKGTRIVAFFKQQNGYICETRSIEPGYDNLFTVITENLPIQYCLSKEKVSDNDYASWKSNFLNNAKIDSAVIASHDRNILKIGYTRGESIQKIELRGEVNKRLGELLSIVQW